MSDETPPQSGIAFPLGASEAYKAGNVKPIQPLG